MKFKRVLTIATAAIAMATTSIQAAHVYKPNELRPEEGHTVTAQMLLTFCTHRDSTIREDCAMYVTGVFDGMALGSDPGVACVHDSYDQIITVVTSGLKAFAQTNPTSLQRPAAAAVGGIIDVWYHCEAKGPK